MRFIVMHKVDAHMEAGAPPNQDIIENMGALVQSSLRQGVFLNGAGLHPSTRRAREPSPPDFRPDNAQAVVRR